MIAKLGYVVYSYVCEVLIVYDVCELVREQSLQCHVLILQWLFFFHFCKQLY